MTSTFPSARSLTASLVRSFLLGAVALSVTSLGAGCGSDETSPTVQTADDFAAERKIAFTNCGSLTFRNGPSTCADPSPEVTCFEEHMAACTAARIRQTFTSDEGGLTVQDYLIVPAEGCSVYLFQDSRGDSLAASPGVDHASFAPPCINTKSKVGGCDSVGTTCGKL